MSDATPLPRAHGRTVTLELSIQGRRTALCGTGLYAGGELLIAVQDPDGDFTLCIDEKTFDGEVLIVGDKLTIRLQGSGSEPLADC